MNKAGRILTNIALWTTTLAAFPAAVAFQMGGLTPVKSKYEMTLKDRDKQDPTSDKDYLYQKAKQVFDRGDELGNDNAVLIVNLPDNKRGLLEKIGVNLFDQEKERIYEEMQKIPNTTVFVYGTNDEDERIDQDHVSALMRALSETKAKNNTIVFTGHGSIYGFTKANPVNEADSLDGKNFLGHDDIAGLISNEFDQKPEAAEKNVNLLLFPCESNLFNQNMSAASVENMFGNMPRFKVYGAAGAGEKSSPGDALRGLEKVTQASIERGNLLSFEEMSVLLASEVSDQPGNFYSPHFVSYECGKMAFDYNFYGEENKIPVPVNGVEKFENNARKVMGAEKATYFISSLRYQLDTGKVASYMHDQIFELSKKDLSKAVKLEDEFSAEMEKGLAEVDPGNADGNKKAEVKAAMTIMSREENEAIFPHVPHFAKSETKSDAIEEWGSGFSLKKTNDYQQRPELFSLMIESFAPPELQQAAHNVFNKKNGLKQ